MNSLDEILHGDPLAAVLASSRAELVLSRPEIDRLLAIVLAFRGCTEDQIASYMLARQGNERINHPASRKKAKSLAELAVCLRTWALEPVPGRGASPPSGRGVE